MRKEDDRLDWAYPPPGAKPIGLGVALHDARVRSLSFDRPTRVCDLKILAPHLDVRVEMRIIEVVSLRTARWSFVEKRGDAMVGLEESVPWEWVAAEIEEETLDVSDATLLREPEEVALHFQGMIGETFHRLTVRGGAVSTEGDVASLEELLDRGASYWDSFGA